MNVISSGNFSKCAAGISWSRCFSRWVTPHIDDKQLNSLCRGHSLLIALPRWRDRHPCQRQKESRPLVASDLSSSAALSGAKSRWHVNKPLFHRCHKLFCSYCPFCKVYNVVSADLANLWPGVCFSLSFSATVRKERLIAGSCLRPCYATCNITVEAIRANYDTKFVLVFQGSWSPTQIQNTIWT